MLSGQDTGRYISLFKGMRSGDTFFYYLNFLGKILVKTESLIHLNVRNKIGNHYNGGPFIHLEIFSFKIVQIRGSFGKVAEGGGGGLERMLHKASTLGWFGWIFIEKYKNLTNWRLASW